MARRRFLRKSAGCAILMRSAGRKRGEPLDIKQLEFFLELCKSGSFTRAAKNLYITTPGLVKSIEKLEAEMGAACSCAPIRAPI